MFNSVQAVTFEPAKASVATEALAVDELDPNWYLAYTQPRCEQVAVTNLEQQHFEAYLPLYKTFKKAVSGFEPMFPRYVFFRPGSLGQSLSRARSTRGVSSVFTFTSIPATALQVIRACEIERNQANLNGLDPLQPKHKPRSLDKDVSQGMEGLLKSTSGKRVTLLINLLADSNR